MAAKESPIPAVRKAVASALQKVNTNAGLRARVQALRKKVAKKRGEPEPKFEKAPGAMQNEPTKRGLEKLKGRGDELDKLTEEAKKK